MTTKAKPELEPKALDSEPSTPAKPSVRPKAVVGLAELVAMGRVPDLHAFALRLYVGDDKKEMKVSEWDDTYKEFMLKPTGMSRDKWHAQYVKNKK